MVYVRMMGAAVAHAGHAILQRQPGGQHSAAHADQRPLHELPRPGQPNLAHARAVNAPVQEGAHILAVMDLWQGFRRVNAGLFIRGRVRWVYTISGPVEHGQGVSPGKACQHQGTCVAVVMQTRR